MGGAPKQVVDYGNKVKDVADSFGLYDKQLDIAKGATEKGLGLIPGSKGGGGFSGGGKKSAVEAAPTSPKDAEKKAEDAAKKAMLEEDKKAKLSKGRNSTILTGALGLSNSPWLQKKTLLGQ